MKIVMLERNSVGLDIAVDCFEKLGEVRYYGTTTFAEIAERIGEAEVVISNKVKLNEETLKNCPNVRLIAQSATGFDNVDLAYCQKRGIRVCNVVNYSTSAVAQHTFALALYLLEKLNHYDNYVKSGAYSAQDNFTNYDLTWRELEGKTWGIIGMGNIGKRVARIAEGFGCRVIHHSLSGQGSSDYPTVDLDTILKEADFLSLHCPLSDLSRNLINKETLKKMKKSAYLINVARGPIVNSADLLEALNNGEIAGAGLDVLAKEPMATDDPLYKYPDSNRLIITPHNAWASIEARENLIHEVYNNIEAFVQGKERCVVK